MARVGMDWPPCPDETGHTIMSKSENGTTKDRQPVYLEIGGKVVILTACPHCGQHVHGRGHAQLAKVYNNHLRDEHHDKWVKQ